MSKAERTRQFIIEKAAPLFNTKGFAGTSLSDMTEATGLTKGSIYGNFSDKDEVALACFEHNYKLVRETIRKEMERHTSFRDKLMVYIEVYSHPQKYPLQFGGCPILNTTVDADDTHPGLRTLVGEAVVNWKNRLAELIEDGVRTKEFKPGTNAEQSALTIIALLEGMIVVRQSTGNREYAKSVIAATRKFIEEL